MGKSAADLARDFDCHPRTVYRDLNALQAAGFPIYTEKIKRKNLWSLLDTVKHHFPIPFNLTELMALYFAQDILKVLKDTVFYDSLESLFQKVKTTLPPESIKYLCQIEQSLQVGPRPYKQYGKFKEIINQVNQAIIQRRYIDILYYTMSRKKMTKRKVAPYKIWFFNGTLYIIGFCQLKQEVRIFALDRVKMLHQTKEVFEIPENFDIREFMRASFGVFMGEPVKVRIWFSEEIAGYIKEKIWHESQRIHEQKDGSIIFEAEVAGTDEIKFWILIWGSKAIVLEPETLKEEIRYEAAKMLEKYDTGLEQDEILTA